MLQDVLRERIELMERITRLFEQEMEPLLPRKPRRGPIQGFILKRLGLPRTGPNMRLINESIKKLGYRMIIQDGWGCYLKG